MAHTHHSFSIELASVYGIDVAIVIHHLQHWIGFNIRTAKNRHDGRTWMFQKISDICAHFPYLSEDRVRDILDILCDGKTRKMKKAKYHPILIRGNYNKHKFDKTNWYAFIDEEQWVSQIPVTKREISRSEAGDVPQAIGRCPATIPDTKTETKPDTKRVNDRSVPLSKVEKKKTRPKTQKVDHTKRLDRDQLHLFKAITALGGPGATKADPQEVTYWLLSLKTGGTERVREVLEFYHQECAKSQIDNIGGWMRWALDNGKKPANEHEERNKRFAEEMAAQYPFVELTAKYVKVNGKYFGTEQYFYHLPEEGFRQRLEAQILKTKQFDEEIA